MGLEDREYMHEPPPAPGPRGDGRPPFRGLDGSPVSVTTALIAANVIVFLLDSRRLTELGVMQAAAVLHGQWWRLLTATYLHAGFEHILFNMLGLYFLGPLVERLLGRWQYFLLYTAGGVAGNALLTLVGAMGFMNPYILGLGASGSVLAIIGAAGVLAPDARILIYFLVPLKLRTFAVLYGLSFVVNIFDRGPNWGGDLCHLAGVIVGAGWAWALTRGRFRRIGWG